MYAYVLENLQKHDTTEIGVEEFNQLRSKYEGKLTASLYTGILFVTVIALIFVLGILYINNYQVNLVYWFSL